MDAKCFIAYLNCSLWVLALAVGTVMGAQRTTAVRYVDCENGDDANDGSSPARAMRYLYAALESVPAGEVPEVLLQQGRWGCQVYGLLPSVGAIIRGLDATPTQMYGDFRVFSAAPGARYLFENVGNLTLDTETLVLVIGSGRGTVELRNAAFSGAVRVQNMDLVMDRVVMTRSYPSGWGASELYTTHGNTATITGSSFIQYGFAVYADGAPATAVLTGNLFYGPLYMMAANAGRVMLILNHNLLTLWGINASGDVTVVGSDIRHGW